MGTGFGANAFCTQSRSSFEDALRSHVLPDRDLQRTPLEYPRVEQVAGGAEHIHGLRVHCTNQIARLSASDRHCRKYNLPPAHHVHHTTPLHFQRGCRSARNILESSSHNGARTRQVQPIKQGRLMLERREKRSLRFEFPDARVVRWYPMLGLLSRERRLHPTQHWSRTELIRSSFSICNFMILTWEDQRMSMQATNR